MAEARLIKKDLFHSAAFSGFSPGELAIVIALIVFADDNGVVCCEPHVVRRSFFPLVGRGSAPSKQVIERVTCQLAANMAEVGRRQGRKCLRFLNWDEHQPYKGKKEGKKEVREGGKEGGTAVGS